MAILAVLLFTTEVSAQKSIHGDVFAGYSYLHATSSTPNLPVSNFVASGNLNGWNGSAQVKLYRWLGGVADFSGHYGTQVVTPGCEVIPVCPPAVGATSRVHSFLFGPRVSITTGKFTPFAHGLFGGAHRSLQATGFSNSETEFAAAYGGGVDYRIVKAIAWRLQGDDLRSTFSGHSQNNFRLSTGVVFHF